MRHLQYKNMTLINLTFRCLWEETWSFWDDCQCDNQMWPTRMFVY